LKKLSIFLFVLFLVSSLNAETFTLEEAVDLARKNNPEIFAMKKKWESVRARVKSEKTLENPVVGYEKMYSGDETNYTISQEFPFPGKLYTKGVVAGTEALMAEQEYRSKEKEIVANVKKTVSMFLFARKSVALFKENVELMEQFSRATESKYAAGKVSQGDALKAQTELSKMLNMLIMAESEKETAQAMLNLLLNLPPENILELSQVQSRKKLDLNLEDSLKLATQNRPELLEAQHHARHFKTMLRSSRLEYWPDFMLSYRYRTAMNPSMDKTYDVMVEASVPLWFWKQKSMAQSANLEQEMADYEYSSMKNMTRYEIKNSWVKIKALEDLLGLYETAILPQSKSVLKVSLANYVGDKTSFLDLLDAQRSLLQSQLEYFKLEADVEQQKADLERILGVEIVEAKK